MQNPPPDPQQYPPNYTPPYSQPQPPYGQPYTQPYGQSAPPPPNPQRYPSQQAYPSYAQRPPSGDASTGLVLEAVCALFGVYGIGWLYRGQTSRGILLLVLGFLWAAFMALAIIFTAGLAALCVGPLHLVFIVLDVISFNNAQRQLSAQ